MNDLLRNGSTCLLVLMLAPVILAEDTDKPDSPEQAAELSVAPLDHVVYPDSRPQWVGRSVHYGKRADTIVVLSGPSESVEESLEELQLMQRAAISTYVASLSKSGQFDFYPINDQEIERDLKTRSYSGEVLKGDITHHEHAVELTFTHNKREQIMAAWNNVCVRDRLGALGVIGFLGLGFLIGSSVVLGVIARRVERREQSQAPVTV